ncbi:hypothetical protein BU16DRAFT_557504 [Lophium mytilinum]|uniref:Uncharacterized protein n=1 Tax=Lophium mytilinum TaxID=390894 RepID=A0A6A6R3P0_9PEZI|nr:hypothetical protein BU16DRAFT_557504 [Lophium mytilinum]
MTDSLSPPPTYHRIDPESLSAQKRNPTPNFTALRIIAVVAGAMFFLLLLFQAQILTLLDGIMRTLNYVLAGREAGGADSVKDAGD